MRTNLSMVSEHMQNTNPRIHNKPNEIESERESWCKTSPKEETQKKKTNSCLMMQSRRAWRFCRILKKQKEIYLYTQKNLHPLINPLSKWLMRNSAAFTNTNTPQTKIAEIISSVCVSVISPEEDSVSSQPSFPLNVEVFKMNKKQDSVWWRFHQSFIFSYAISRQEKPVLLRVFQ